ncbi:MAG: hypothetical protein HN741_08800, partial [Anaerolineae bacterium]|nr:hypothetical protein [Anaerolineae bacterium]
MERTQKNMPSKKLLAIWAHHIARVNSKRITKYLAYHYSKEFKFVFVGGYPKSGTTWVSQQVAAYLDLPFLRHSPPVPQAFPAVIHHHWDYHPSSDHSIYVTRDGRDAMVSSYMSVMKNFEITSAKFASVSKWHPVRNLTYFTG